MMVTVCKKCRQVVTLLSVDESELAPLRERKEWRRSYPCIRALCKGRAYVTPVKEARAEVRRGATLVQLSPIEYYRALFGIGRPGATVTLQHIEELLTTKKIRGVLGSEVGSPTRVILERLTLEDGTELHFASSSHGAAIFDVQEPTRRRT